ncbi:MAG: putative metal-binding motif-containing protein, partial [Alphaproteobacteria bacterium]|nr:putative metal-binding motif-containing protein [Alphaproteobacteria bacterium]
MEGEERVTLEVVDGEGAWADDTVILVVERGEAPTAEILTPESGDTFFVDDPIGFIGLVADDDDDLADLVITWESDLDGILSLPGVPDGNGLTRGDTFLSEGTHTITLWVEDPSGLQGADNIAILVEPCAALTFYEDNDGDGYGAVPVEACEQPPGTVVDGGDCDDDNAQVNPGYEEICDELDNDCDGE